MNYLEEAIKAVQSGLEMETFEGEQSRATVSIAGALIAIAEHLDTFGTGAAMRREIDKLGKAVILSTQVFEQHNERLTDIEVAVSSTINNQASRIDVIGCEIEAIAALDERLENLERGKVAISKNGEVVEMVDGAMAGRIGQIEARLEKLEGEDVELGRYVKESLEGRFGELARRINGLVGKTDEMDSVIRRLTNRVSGLEAPDAPRVGVWQTCGECEGKGIDPDSDEEGARCGVCEGRGMVEVHVRSKGGGKWYRCKVCDGGGWRGIDTETTQRCDICYGRGRVRLPVESDRRRSEAEWADRMQEAHFSVASLECKLEESRHTIDEILQVVNDSGLSREEMIKEVDKALR